MADGNRLDQLFVKPEGGRTSALLVTENVAGARFRTQLTFPTSDVTRAVQLLARHLVNRGDVTAVAGARVRVEGLGGLRDAPELKAALTAEFRRLASDVS